MNLIGLTGGIGMGKSTAAKLLAERLVPVVDTDQLARDVVEPGQPALKEIVTAFGSDCLNPDGRLRRDRLAQRVFSNPNQRQRLESILHPRIRQLWLQQVEVWKKEGRSRGVVVIPLLYETGAETHFDTILCVACSATTQRQRLLARHWTEAELEQRLAAQWAVPKKMDLAHFVVWTEGGLETHAAQLDRIFKNRA